MSSVFFNGFFVRYSFCHDCQLIQTRSSGWHWRHRRYRLAEGSNGSPLSSMTVIWSEQQLEFSAWRRMVGNRLFIQIRSLETLRHVVVRDTGATEQRAVHKTHKNNPKNSFLKKKKQDCNHYYRSWAQVRLNTQNMALTYFAHKITNTHVKKTPKKPTERSQDCSSQWQCVKSSNGLLKR